MLTVQGTGPRTHHKETWWVVRLRAGISGNDELDGGRGIDHCVGDEGDTFRYCDGNAVEVPSGIDPLRRELIAFSYFG